MFNFFARKTDLKGFKVCTNDERNKKYGIAADSLNALVEKVRDKFKLADFDLFYDGTLISDDLFFRVIPSNSQIVVVKSGDEYKTDFDVIFEFFRKTYQDTFHARDLLKDFLVNNQCEDVVKAVLHLHNEIDERTKSSTRDEHPEWFEKSLERKNATKEEIMRVKAKDRIKGYFYKTKDELTKSHIYRHSPRARQIINDLLDDFFLLLSGVDYFCCLFDRSHDKRFAHNDDDDDETDARAVVAKRRRIDADTRVKIRESSLFDDCLVTLCNELGSFSCHGAWRAQKCDYEHEINPYASREALILFQIFNLDHQVEIARSIFPSILASVERLCEDEDVVTCERHKRECTELSTLTYFFEIFTVRNLKLVHIVCHDKGSHDLASKARLLCGECKEAKMFKRLKMKIA